MVPYFTEYYKSFRYLYICRQCQKAVDEARNILAKESCEAGRNYFTGGGSESDNWVLKATAEAESRETYYYNKIEHHAILHTAEYLEKGFEVTYLDVDENGLVRLEDLKPIRRT